MKYYLILNLIVSINEELLIETAPKSFGDHETNQITFSLCVVPQIQGVIAHHRTNVD